MRPVAVIGGARRRCAACLLPLAVVVMPPVTVPPVADMPHKARLPLAKDEDVRGILARRDREERRGKR